MKNREYLVPIKEKGAQKVNLTFLFQLAVFECLGVKFVITREVSAFFTPEASSNKFP